MKTPLRLAPAFAAVLPLLFSPGLHAQSEGVPIESTRPVTPKSVLAAAEKLREEGGLLDMEKISECLSTPTPGVVDLPKPRGKKLRGREIAGRAREGTVEVGWLYLCKRCEHWHIKLSGGYAIAKDAVATCHHCVEPSRSDMREGYFIAVDSENRVRAVTGVIAKSRTMDAAILRVSGPPLNPLPLNDKVAPGDPAYCLSDPLGQSGYFSEGIVNRFYRHDGGSGVTNGVDEFKALRLNVSTDWAPGSSGAAVLDEAANVIGHVSTIMPLSESRSGIARLAPETPVKPPVKESAADETKKTPKATAAKTPRAPTNAPPDRFFGATLITLHEAVPARGVLALARAANAAAKAAAEAKKSAEKSAEKSAARK
jgi:hypothetical protein